MLSLSVVGLELSKNYRVGIQNAAPEGHAAAIVGGARAPDEILQKLLVHLKGRTRKLVAHETHACIL